MCLVSILCKNEVGPKRLAFALVFFCPPSLKKKQGALFCEVNRVDPGHLGSYFFHKTQPGRVCLLGLFLPRPISCPTFLWVIELERNVTV